MCCNDFKFALDSSCQVNDSFCCKLSFPFFCSLTLFRPYLQCIYVQLYIYPNVTSMSVVPDARIPQNSISVTGSLHSTPGRSRLRSRFQIVLFLLWDLSLYLSVSLYLYLSLQPAALQFVLFLLWEIASQVPRLTCGSGNLTVISPLTQFRLSLSVSQSAGPGCLGKSATHVSQKIFFQLRWRTNTKVGSTREIESEAT